MRPCVRSVALFGVVSLCGIARGDEGEWRIGAGGGGAVANARLGGASGTGVGYVARGRVCYGVPNTFELGLVGSYSHASDIAFDGAALDGQTGNLFADLSEVSVGAEVRWTPGLGLARAFERTSPYVAARAGAALLMRTSQQLLTESGQLLLEPKDDLHLAPFVGAALGVEHRFGDHFFVAGEISVSLGGDVRLVGLTGDAAWAWY